LSIKESELHVNKRPVSLVAGAAGFIGSHLTDRLLREGHQVIGLDNLCTGNMDNLEQAVKDPLFKFILGDITEKIELPTVKLDYIWHLASPASPVDYRRLSLETLFVNSQGTRSMLELALQHDAHFLLASTSEVYGDPKVHPQVETYWGNVNSVGERACYDEGKRFAEALAWEYRRRYELNARIIRIFNTYGPRMQIRDGRVVPNFIWQALRKEPLTIYGEGNQTRSFVFVDDEVEGILRAMLYPDTDGEIINLGNPEEKTILAFAGVVSELCGVSVNFSFQPLPVDDPTRRCPDISKAHRLLSWFPETSLNTGLGRTIEYFQRKIVNHVAERRVV
jgi:nucleoside-diphosphate-sugar epimerase